MKKFLTLFSATFLLLLSGSGNAESVDWKAFINPPDDCRPMTWMHIMDNNASKEGMEKDLKALADVGVGGALVFSVSQEMPYGDVIFNSQEYRDILQHGIKVADQLGLKFGVHNCDGWSASGGPWVKVEDSMKQLVWSETVVEGGTVQANLPQPKKRDGFYRDIALVAYPATGQELDQEKNALKRITCSSGEVEAAKLLDGELSTTLNLPMNSKNQRSGWILLEYDKPFTARSVMLEHHHSGAKCKFYSSQDGKDFDLISDFPFSNRPGKNTFTFETSFQEVEARFFKFELTGKRDRDIEVNEIDLNSFKCLPHWQAQAAYSGLSGELNSRIRRSPMEPSDFIPLDQVKVLAPSSLQGDQLKTKLPSGTWRVMRFGFTTRGEVNIPATPAGTGYENDKLNAESLDKHFDAYVGKIIKESGSLAGKSLMYAEIDSFEMGWQTWTDDLDQLFNKEMNYDLLSFLPLLAGRPIGDPDTTEAVLCDYRNFVTDLMTKNYFQRFTDLCHQHGLQSYIEPYGNGPINELQVGGACDIPMGEFWMSRVCIIRSAAHAAHIYGKPVVSSEAFTAWSDNWKGHPYLMKNYGDNAWAQGINEFVFHRFAHQANTHVAPGMTMGSIGSHIDRTQTWWYNAGKAWMKYNQRGSYLLRQGVPVSDVLVFVGDTKGAIASTTSSVRLQPGFNMDSCQSDVLFDRVTVKNGKLVLPEGTSYEVLILKSSEKLHMKTLQRLGELADAGATIIGNKPQQPIGYLEQQEITEEFKALADKLWGDGKKAKNVGKGRIIPGSHFPEDYQSLSLEKDLIIQEIPDAHFAHRRIGTDDVYFVHHRAEEAKRLHCSFRVDGRIPELWYPDTGRIERQLQFTHQEGRTDLAIDLDPCGSVFVVFRDSSANIDPVVSVTPGTGRVILDDENKMRLIATEPGLHKIALASGKSLDVMVEQLQSPIVIDQSWQVEFEGPGLKSDKVETFNTLTDWKDHTRDDLKHFSGTGTYRTDLQVPKKWLKGSKRIYLDLGEVNIAAEVIINGKNAGILWKPPFKIDVTDQVAAGKNRIEIRVTNLWTNRLIGDESLKDTSQYDYRKYITKDPMPRWYVNNEPMPEGPRSTFTTNNFYRNDRTLLPSGLLGPVVLKQEKFQQIEQAVTN